MKHPITIDAADLDVALALLANAWVPDRVDGDVPDHADLGALGRLVQSVDRVMPTPPPPTSGGQVYNRVHLLTVALAARLRAP